ncbi:hypothetical protein AO369_1968 [Moraxella catarrhalis]|nr:hypothetical protein AO369_1968 [Moraxella catarrhalis]
MVLVDCGIHPNQPMNKALIYHEGFILSLLSDALSGHHS